MMVRRTSLIGALAFGLVPMPTYLKTAKALGLTIPPSVLTRADKIIE